MMGEALRTDRSEAARAAGEIRSAIDRFATTTPEAIAKAASSGPWLRGLDAELAASVRLELVRAVMRCPASAALAALDAFDLGLPRGWALGEEPWPRADELEGAASVREAWEVAKRAEGVVDPLELDQLRDEVRAVLASHPEHLSGALELVDAVALATRAR